MQSLCGKEYISNPLSIFPHTFHIDTSNHPLHFPSLTLFPLPPPHISPSISLQLHSTFVYNYCLSIQESIASSPNVQRSPDFEYSDITFSINCYTVASTGTFGERPPVIGRGCCCSLLIWCKGRTGFSIVSRCTPWQGLPLSPPPLLAYPSIFSVHTHRENGLQHTGR